MKPGQLQNDFAGGKKLGFLIQIHGLVTEIEVSFQADVYVIPPHQHRRGRNRPIRVDLEIPIRRLLLAYGMMNNKTLEFHLRHPHYNS
ncbi:hypothetical protein M2277_002490 [Paenibacillus sp. LBL]|uniref:hypothetical protein n=1 Tax=Paenibacillus sp. LBL TaxID=2940563 RepID=UPI0024736104|nr:hypothetical protein [Paenibacillus sp. LBL]MDH6671828.1 hypothetical protein [Paenibacillus sp. LBL]